MSRTTFKKLHVYRLAEDLADAIWRIVSAWNRLATDTVGKQLVRAADGIGAKISEGAGRGSPQENRRFVRIARGSLHEAEHWLRRAYSRGLLTDDPVDPVRSLLDELAPRLNAYLRSIGGPHPVKHE